MLVLKLNAYLQSMPK